uniref:Interleukin-12 subunit beta n=1 Tax=Salarias fasciatus TaxID=181472 RepID=A0A672GEI2_SALFA
EKRTPWIFRLLLIIVIARRNDGESYSNPVTLTCGGRGDGAVTWKFGGEVMEDSDPFIQQQNQTLVLDEVDTPMLGEYSCWRGNQMVSSTYILLQEKEEEEFDSLLKCRARSYDCEFNCSWTSSEYTAVRLGLGPDCSEGGESCHWIRKSGVDPDGGLQFVLSHSLTPYSEESSKLEVTAEAIKDLSIVRKTRRFYLRDIVQPDSSHIVRCKEVGENLNVTVAPPPSWSIPHSFFSLEHEIQYVLRDDGRTECSSTSLVPKGISRLRVRSRDPLVPSAWSLWTPWTNQSKCLLKDLCASFRMHVPSLFVCGCRHVHSDDLNFQFYTHWWA